MLKLHQVHIGSGAEKDIVIKKVWNSNARKQALKQIVFDGQKLAWYVFQRIPHFRSSR
jgi:eukaryotic translation initiation factor 2C